MFELPAVLGQDHKKNASMSNTKAFFRYLEKDEVIRIASGNHSSPDNPQFVEMVIRKVHLKEKQEVKEYIGLVSHAVFDFQGNLIGDTYSETQALSGGGPRLHKRTNPESGGGEANELQDRGFSLEDIGRFHYDDDFRLDSVSAASTVERQIVTLRTGLELLPRNNCRPQVLMDNLITQKIVHISQGENVWNLSSKAKRVLMRSNYRAPIALKQCFHDDQWANHNYMRRRSLQVVTNLLYICLERRDYERAWSALGCLLREPHVDIRLIWMPALELLAWRHIEFPRTKGPDDFLDWLIANFPYLPQSKSHVHKARPRSTIFMPVAIMVKLANGNYIEALRKAEQAVNSAQYTYDPTCWALCGLAHMKLSSDGGGRQALKCFKKCLELGGVLPNRIRNLAAKISVDEDGLKDAILDGLDVMAESESESGIEEDIKSESRSASESGSDSEDARSEMNFIIKNELPGKRERNYFGSPQKEETNKGAIDSEIVMDTIPSKQQFNISDIDELSDENSLGIKKPKTHDSDPDETASNEAKELEKELPSSQPFFSQSLTLGAEMGASDSDDDSF